MSRNRKIGSIKNELVNKAREAALSAVQIFNNPLIKFKSEMFIVNMHIAWTYLLHAYYREKKIEYRYVERVLPSGRKKYARTANGAIKYLSLRDCLDHENSPVEQKVAKNLKFLIGLRDEIEHQMTTRIDDAFSARYQACCLNFNDEIKEHFGERLGIDKHLAFSLQFSSLSDEQAQTLENYRDILPSHISRFVEGYDGSLSEEEFNSPKYAYRVLFTPKTVNHPGQADKVIEFVKPDSEAAKGINITYAAFKEKEKQKYIPSTIVNLMQKEGYPRFNMSHHTQLWKKHDARNPTKGYGVMVEKYWYWYEPWLNIVRQYCKSNRRKYE